mmetsp:Transcript_26827/g.53552  ORF Transcript_26827/g.53552 Transcript_26827/m.53552 type:complete len:105 (-) Transcript_26827:5-319(-)
MAERIKGGVGTADPTAHGILRGVAATREAQPRHTTVAARDRILPTGMVTGENCDRFGVERRNSLSINRSGSEIAASGGREDALGEWIVAYRWNRARIDRATMSS